MADNKKRAVYDLIINGELANKSLKDLEGALKQVRAQAKLTTDPAELKKLGEQYQMINGKIQEQNALLMGNKKATDSLKSAFGEIALAAGAAFSVTQIAAWLKAGIQGALEIEQINTQLNNQLTLMNGESQDAVERLAKQAADLTGLFKDEEIKKVQLYFAQYGLGADKIEQALPVIRDFAAGTSKTLEEAAEIFTKGLEGSAKGLKNYGVVLKDNATAAENFDLILGKLNNKFEGQTELVGNTTAGAIKKLENVWEDFSETLGAFFGPALDSFADFGQAIFDSRTEAQKLNDEFDKTSKETKELTNTIDPLLTRYDELKSKSSLSTIEQTELRDIISKIGDTIPTAITQFDEYGKAINISSEAARKFLKQQQDLTAFLNKDAITATLAEMYDVRKEAEVLQDILNRGVTVSGGTSAIERRLSTKEITQKSEQLTGLQKTLTNLDLKLQLLEGRFKPPTETKDSSIFNYLKASAKELEEWLIAHPNDRLALDQLERLTTGGKKLQDELRKYSDETQKIIQQGNKLTADNNEDEYQRQKNNIDLKFQDEKEKLLAKQILKPDNELTQAEIKRKNAVNAALLALEENYQKELGDLYEKAGNELNEKDFKKQEAALKSSLNKQDTLVVKQLAKAEITQEEADTLQLKNQLNYLTLRLINLKQHHQDTEEAEKQVQETIVKLNAATVDELTKTYKDSFDKLEPEQKKRVAEIMQQLAVLVASGADTSSEVFKKLMEELAKIYEQAGEKTKEFFKRVPQWLNDSLKVIGDFAAQIGSIWESTNQIADNRDRKRLDKIHANSERERAIYDKLLKNKQISQTDYQKHIDKLDKQEEQANKKATRDAAVRNQKMAIFRASLNAFQAISTTLAEYPFPFNIALAALTAFAAFKQVQAIKSEPLPELGTGGILRGPKHNSPSRGLTVLDENGNPYKKLEGGELIGSAAFVENNPDLAAAIVASGKNGGRLSPSYLNRAFPAVNLPEAAQAVSQINTGRPSVGSQPLEGKAAVNISGTNATFERQMQEQNIIFQNLNQLMEKMHKTLDNGVAAKIVYRDWKKEMKRIETITGDK